MAPGPSTTANILLFLGCLTFGSFNMLNMKMQFQVCVVTDRGLDVPTSACPEGGHLFTKPWMANFVMFVGEFFCLFVYYGQRMWSDIRRRQAGKPPRPVESTGLGIFAVPACCDVVGSGLSAVAMVLVPAPVVTMLQSSFRVVFTAALTKFWLKKQLQQAHRAGVAVTFVGLLLVGSSTLLDTASSQSSGSALASILGISFVFLSQLAAGFQGVFEEHLLQGRRVSAKKTVGLEGFWGMVFQGALLLVFCYIPGEDHGTQEYLPDTITMIAASYKLQLLLITFAFGVGGTNICSLTVAKRFSAVTRCIAGNLTTIVVWAVSLWLYYFVDRSLGAAWTPYSPLQLLGFIVIVYGAFVYNGFVRLPFSATNAPLIKPWSPGGHKGLDDWEFSPAVSPAVSPRKSLDDLLRQPLIVDADVAEKDTLIVPSGLNGTMADESASDFIVSDASLTRQMAVNVDS
jgi:hypothetical protein